MTARPKVSVFVGVSIDGFIAGPGDDLGWLPPPIDGDDHGFSTFLAGVGALLMGRRTFDVVSGFPGPWPYGDRPVLVATHRPLTASRPEVRAVDGPIERMLAEARAAAGARDVYLDGGALVRAAHDAGAIDEVTLTVVPTVLGRGTPLFAGVDVRRSYALRSAEVRAGGLVQLRYGRP